ncbi:DUF1648 domain-containing protein [Sinomicrobium kalidii]|uniref:DUF1648 domain-containing protein n=1 Tax=Sinomicrobium kalidii TaxID=2900738 RepID=UPI001E49E56A|nr:DUF1648 domain-containing protein [Sinomicrobium kalidii]UGU16537.1 DUF1648 domain-containing protein [Sinomicrobium kalidii]
MTNRPRIKPNLTTTDKIIEIISWIAVPCIWILTLKNYPDLPESIPIHYNSAGEANGFGGKEHILALPIIATILFIGLATLNKYPHIFNYPVLITQKNALQQYTYATRLLRILNLVIVIIFGLIVYKTIQNVNGNANGLGIWFLPTTLALIFVPIIYYLLKIRKIKNKDTSYNNV